VSGRALALLFLIATTAGAQDTGTRPLRRLAAETTAIALVDVTRTETYDEGRLVAYRVHVARVLRGRLDVPDPGVVDTSAAAQRLPLLTEGQRAVLLLKPAPDHSYLRQNLPPGDYYETVAGRDGVMLVGAEGDVEAIERALADGAASAALDGAQADAARRKLAFAELASGNPRLTADALAELRDLGAFAPLSPDEIATLQRTLRDRRIDASTRAGLMTLLGERKVGGAVEALAGAEAEVPYVLEALVRARSALGAPATAKDLAGELSSSDPQVRAAAVRGLAGSADAQALDQHSRYATLDPSVDVRVAAVETLGERKRADALPLLGRTFSGDDVRVRQASARAMMAIGGPEVESTLGSLALQAPSPEARHYAALVLIMTAGRNSLAVRRLAASQPDPEIVKMIEEGVEVHDH
jgi:HEAT repeat protein